MALPVLTTFLAKQSDYALGAQGQQQLKQEAMDHILRLAATMFGVGVLGRGAMGAKRLMFDQRPKIAPTPPEIRIPYQSPQEEEEGIPEFSSEKKSNDWLRENISNPLAEIFRTEQPSFAMGDNSQSHTGIPWFLPGLIGAGTLAGYGGYKAMDSVADRLRSNELDSELESARQEYYQLLSQAGAKQASEKDELSKELDTMADKLVKKADSMEKHGFGEGAIDTGLDWGGKAIGGYGTLGLLAAIAAGIPTFNLTRARSRKAVLDRALRERMNERYRQSPPPMTAVLEPAPALPAPEAPEEEEDGQATQTF